MTRMTTTVQTATQLPKDIQIGDIGKAGLISLTMAALRIRNPWTATTIPTSPFTSEKIITLDEVSWHDHSGDCWIIVYDRVYDITKFLHQHPGGADVLLEHAGRDATVAFRGTGHSQAAITAMQPYLVGHLPRSECIYRAPGGISLSDLPS